ncbi:XTP/dITP diphosphohydrolase [Seinonella peptonophila]|uniref:dITP/XTP pyrophosphatase n=1 Tax=Seinonella peptonophila TaxID=112248 RepID=A0A1M4TW59_9BACL|nr:XTP/dITP diphosphatase [Seinonella peptonophila]SHE48663.1 XTP/dITP diphosphohydrolase [Seinonella peptonophila]
MKQKWPFSQLIIATGNKNKIKQFQDLLGQSLSLEVVGIDHFPGVQPVKEDQDTFAGNARKKAEALAEEINGPVVADDSGIVVPALDGRPGIYSARYAGIDATDEENNRKLIREMTSLSQKDRAAYYVCVMALAIPGETTQVVEGRCNGIVLTEGRGTDGFGYDPLFYIPSEGKTMAELPATRRYQLSHRAIASQKLLQQLESRYDFSGV